MRRAAKALALTVLGAIVAGFALEFWEIARDMDDDGPWGVR